MISTAHAEEIGLTMTRLAAKPGISVLTVIVAEGRAQRIATDNQIH